MLVNALEPPVVCFDRAGRGPSSVRQTDRQFIRARSRIPHDVLSRRSTSICRLTVRMVTWQRGLRVPARPLRAVIVATWSAVGVGVRRTLATVRL